MDIKTILVPLSGTPMDARTLAVAAPIAKRYEAHVTALFAAPDPSAIPMAMMTDGTGLALSEGLFETLQKQIEQRRDQAEASFAAWRKSAKLSAAKRPAAGASAALVIEIGEAAELVRAHGVVADLVILPLPGSDEAGSELVLEAALFDGGRPVLAVPDVATPAPLADAPILIAWNGSAEAAHALTAALPFLAASRQVTVLHAGEGDRRAMLNPVTAYLARHGIKAATRGVADHGDAGKTILDEAERLGAGLLVIGAYTHSRVREFIFGGVTSHVLRHARLPVLTAH
jgi:nucleotide-binding universal stress UspA family protein